jgi:hypothetical protein
MKLILLLLAFALTIESGFNLSLDPGENVVFEMNVNKSQVFLSLVLCQMHRPIWSNTFETISRSRFATSGEFFISSLYL